MFSPSVSERVAADAQAALKVREHTGPVLHYQGPDQRLVITPELIEWYLREQGFTPIDTDR